MTSYRGGLKIFTFPGPTLRHDFPANIVGHCQAIECYELAFVSDTQTSLSYCRGCWNLLEFARKLSFEGSERVWREICQ